MGTTEKLETQRREQNAQLKQYEDELARKRQQAENEAARARNAELVKMQEQAAERAEALRRDTEKKIQMEKRADRRSLKRNWNRGEYASKGYRRGRREDFGKSSERRRDSKADVSESGSGNDESDQSFCKKVWCTLGEATTELLSNPQQMTMLVGGLSLVSGWSIFVERRRKVWIQAAGKVFGTTEFDSRDVKRGVLKPRIVLGQIFWAACSWKKSMETRVKQLATATANTRARKAPFRNILLYGPPGTGKRWRRSD